MPPVDKGSGGGLGGGLGLPAGISFGEAAASLGVCVDVAGERVLTCSRGIPLAAELSSFFREELLAWAVNNLRQNGYSHT